MKLRFENLCTSDEIPDDWVKANVVSEVTEEKQIHYLPLKWEGKAKLKKFPVYIYVLDLDIHIYGLPCSCIYSSANVR